MGESILADFGNYFWFSNKECTVDIDPVSIEETTKETNYVLHVKAGSNEYRYGYRPKTGLVQLSKNNAANERRKPLLAFLSLNMDHIKEVKQFIHTYGFFLSASSEEKMDVDYTKCNQCFIFRYCNDTDVRLLSNRI